MLLFGRYQVCREIGRGGFSIVYLTEDLLAQDRQIALKRIPLHGLSSRHMIDATETYNRERKILSSLASVDGVPTCYGAFTDSKNWYLLLEYIAGQTLEDYLRQTPQGHLCEQEVLEIGQQLARILRQVHARQIIVRDIKPANIMRTPTGKLFLIDFGIARFFKPGQKKDTVPLGSPGYAAPEQYGRVQTDVRADIYGLGVTLQTLLSGRDPFELSQGEISRNPSPTLPHFQQILDAMLAPERDQRLPTMKRVTRGLFRSSLAHSRNRWHLFYSFCTWLGLGVFPLIGISLLIRTSGVLPWFLLVIIISLLPRVNITDRVCAQRASSGHFWRRRNRYADTRFLYWYACCLIIMLILAQITLSIWLPRQ
jgi:serine/threonine protein kinase